MALQRVARAHDRGGRERPAAAPARHRVGLGRRSAQHGAIPHRPRQHAREVVRRRIVDQLLVAEVEQDPDAALGGLGRQGFELVLRHQRAGRIAGRVDDDAARLRRERLAGRCRRAARKPSSACVCTMTGVASASLICSTSVGQPGMCVMTSSPAPKSTITALKSACLPPAVTMTSLVGVLDRRSRSCSARRWPSSARRCRSWSCTS